MQQLAILMATFWGAAAVFVFVVLGLVARLSGFSIIRFIRLIKDELLIILGTSSSETVLPRLLVKLERAGASRQSVGVVLPTGYSFNLDGTCIYLTLGALFIVQASGQDMAIGEQLALAALMELTSKGAAGITGAGLVTLTASLQAFGGTFFSPESIAIGIAQRFGIGGNQFPVEPRGGLGFDQLFQWLRGQQFDRHRALPSARRAWRRWSRSGQPHSG
jgi:aerobic C4-dicarboxylate transport protein